MMLVAFKTMEQRQQHLCQLLEGFFKYGLKINISNLGFGVSQIDFLGYTAKPDGIQSQTDRIAAILNFPLP